MAEKPKPKAEEVRIRRTKIMVPTEREEAEAMIYVTYTVKGLAPGFLEYPEKEWSEAKEAEDIRADIKKRRAQGPTVIRV